jgi:hypothetical protein
MPIVSQLTLSFLPYKPSFLADNAFIFEAPSVKPYFRKETVHIFAVIFRGSLNEKDSTTIYLMPRMNPYVASEQKISRISMDSRVQLRSF